MFMKHRPRSL